MLEAGGHVTLDPAELAAVIPLMAGQPVLVVGDLMLDHYLAGEAERISPEAPIPVIKVENEAHMLGGAGNVAKNIAAAGGIPELISMVGDDDTGRVLQGLLSRENIASHLLVEKHRLTTIKTRVIARNQQMLRVDREQVHALSESSSNAFRDLLAKLVPRFKVVVVSDYGKGLIGKAVIEELKRLAKASEIRPKIMVDPKVINSQCYQGVDLLTPNAKEAGEISGTQAVGREGVIKAGLGIFRKLRCQQLCITLGPEGLALFESPGCVWHLPTVARKVFDVTGAGDTVMALVALGTAAGLTLVQAGVLANYAAGLVVAQVGTSVAKPDELARAIQTGSPPVVENWLNLP